MKRFKLRMSKVALFFMDQFRKWSLKTTIALQAITASLLLNTAVAFAEEGTGADPFTNMINFACEWLIKAGMATALVGGAMFALAWQREDSEGKSKGTLTLIAGCMLMGIGNAPGMFGF